VIFKRVGVNVLFMLDVMKIFVLAQELLQELAQEPAQELSKYRKRGSFELI